MTKNLEIPRTTVEIIQDIDYNIILLNTNCFDAPILVTKKKDVEKAIRTDIALLEAHLDIVKKKLDSEEYDKAHSVIRPRRDLRIIK